MLHFTPSFLLTHGLKVGSGEGEGAKVPSKILHIQLCSI